MFLNPVRVLLLISLITTHLYTPHVCVAHIFLIKIQMCIMSLCTGVLHMENNYRLHSMTDI